MFKKKPEQWTCRTLPIPLFMVSNEHWRSTIPSLAFVHWLANHFKEVWLIHVNKLAVEKIFFQFQLSRISRNLLPCLILSNEIFRVSCKLPSSVRSTLEVYKCRCTLKSRLHTKAWIAGVSFMKGISWRWASFWPFYLCQSNSLSIFTEFQHLPLAFKNMHITMQF